MGRWRGFLGWVGSEWVEWMFGGLGLYLYSFERTVPLDRGRGFTEQKGRPASIYLATWRWGSRSLTAATASVSGARQR